MNNEKLKFVAGETTEAPPMDVIEAGDDVVSDSLARTFVSEIHVIGEDIWIGRITTCGYTSEDAEALRDRLLWALNQPIVPAQWQYLSKLDWESDEADGTKSTWINLDNGGEAARLKGEGYEIRALYTKQPII